MYFYTENGETVSSPLTAYNNLDFSETSIHLSEHFIRTDTVTW
jgi:hypothetical protein